MGRPGCHGDAHAWFFSPLSIFHHQVLGEEDIVAHDAEYDIVRVAQRHHCGTTLGLALTSHWWSRGLLVLLLGMIVSGARGASCWTRLSRILVLKDSSISRHYRGQARSSGTSGTLHILQWQWGATVREVACSGIAWGQAVFGALEDLAEWGCHLRGSTHFWAPSYEVSCGKATFGRGGLSCPFSNTFVTGFYYTILHNFGYGRDPIIFDLGT